MKKLMICLIAILAPVFLLQHSGVALTSNSTNFSSNPTAFGFEAWLGADRLVVPVGDLFFVNLYVKNTGESVDYYNISYTNDPGIKVSTEKNQISELYPGEIDFVLVKILPTSLGNKTINLTIVSLGNYTVNQTLTLVVEPKLVESGSDISFYTLLFALIVSTFLVTRKLKLFTSE